MSGRPHVGGQDYLQHMIDREADLEDERDWRERTRREHCEKFAPSLAEPSHVDEFGALDQFGGDRT